MQSPPTPTPPEPDQELHAFEPLSRLLYDAFEVSSDLACKFFEDQNKDIDPYLFPNLVRYHVKSFLAERAHLIASMSRGELGNNGLALRFAGRFYRIWKVPLPAFPLAGRTSATLNFLNQWQLPMVFDPASGVMTFSNRTVLWAVDSNYRLSVLHLACPMKATRQDSEVYWSVHIPHPIAQQGSMPANMPSVPAASDELPFDLIESRDEQGAADS
jgi:hypothetical protein